MKKQILFFTFLLAAVAVHAQKSEVVTSTNKFVGSLSAELKSRLQYKFDDAERFNWNFVPINRNGVGLHDLSVSQKEAGMSLLHSAMSEEGYRKATTIISLENILKVVEKRGPDDHYRDPTKYYFTVFGSPDKIKPWGWRFEGHHLSLNFTCVNGEIVSVTPAFFGSSPGIVKEGESKGLQVLKQETELGFKLVNSFNATQLAAARIADTAPPEIITGNTRVAIPLNPKGLSYKEMNAEQQKVMLELLDVYVKNYAFGISRKFMEKINKAGIENLFFAWAGSLSPGVGHYYRIQGPMLLIEYDNIQNNANHVHTMIRDLNDDFAADILREHYAQEHK